MVSKLNIGISGIHDIVHIATDDMSASITLPTPDKSDEWTLDMVIDILNAAGVKTGIDKDLIKEIIDNNRYTEEIVVAKGKRAVDGKDGYYTFLYTPEERDRGTPIIRDDGKVEYIKTEHYTIVNEGDIIARYTRPTPGEFGYTVTSRILAPSKGKALTPLKGKGFVVVNEGSEYVAGVSGKLDIKETSIIISPVLQIEGNVDIAVGHIDFSGDVIIKGDVLSGMKVSSKGSITIYGHVGASYVAADKDITVKQGIQGKGKGKLVAGGDIIGVFCERAILRAKGNITINVLMDCDVKADGIIKVEGRQGLILGGNVQAISGIEAVTVGSEAEVVSALYTGVPDTDNFRIIQLKALMKKVEEEVALLDRSTKIFERMERTQVTKEIENRRMKIIRAKVIKDTELKGYMREYNQINDNMNIGRDSKVIVHGIVYRGTRIEIMGVRYNTMDNARDVAFRLRGTEILMEGNR